MKLKAVFKTKVSVGILVSPDAWRENNEDAEELATEGALDYFEERGTLLPESMKVSVFEPGEWDNTTSELNAPNNHSALLVFNGEVIRLG